MLNENIKKIKWGRRLGVGIGLLLVITGVWLEYFLLSSQGYDRLKINNNYLKITRATTSYDQQKGLCCRDSLSWDEGMLFVHEKPGVQRFWMKDTRIPLDMVWMDSAKKIIYIAENVQPEIGVEDSRLKIYGPQELSQYILETNAGWVKSRGITVGDQARF